MTAENQNHPVHELPQGDTLLRCIQCGTCSASCPLIRQMDMPPRALFALIRDGDIQTALRANTQWFCVSCYQCMVRCPQEIPITDLMYRLKQMAVSNKTVPPAHKLPDLYKAFAHISARHGRVYEALVMGLYGLRHMKDAIGQGALGIQLLKRGRLELLPKKIPGADAISKSLTGIGFRKESS